MTSAHSRRRLLSTASTICLAALAGCSGDADDGSADADSDPGEQPDEGGNESSGNESNGGDGDGTSPRDDGDTSGDEKPPMPDPVDWTGEDRGTVSVGPDGEFVFEPDAVEIAPGTVVRWLWESDTHNIVPVDQPVGADWAGEDGIENEDHSYEFTFETPGTYEYVCEPHEAQEMRGYVVVTADEQ